MPRSSRALLLALCLPIVTSAASLLGADPRTHWRGWLTEAYPGAWVRDGDALTLRGPVVDGWHRDGGYLVSRERFDDFDLRFDFRTSPGANSGVMVRVQPGAGTAWPWQSGTEYQILDPGVPPAPGVVADRTADLYGLVPAVQARPRPAGQWNEGRIVACGRRLQHWLNGRRVVDVDLDGTGFRQAVAASKFAAHDGFARAAAGHIALQDHGKPVWFRRLSITHLDAGCRPRNRGGR